MWKRNLGIQNIKGATNANNELINVVLYILRTAFIPYLPITKSEASTGRYGIYKA